MGASAPSNKELDLTRSLYDIGPLLPLIESGSVSYTHLTLPTSDLV